MWARLFMPEHFSPASTKVPLHRSLWDHHQMQGLRPGGLAVHTSQFNLSFNTYTVDNLDIVLFRRRDIEEMGCRLRKDGRQIEVDFDSGMARPIATSTFPLQE